LPRNHEKWHGFFRSINALQLPLFVGILGEKTHEDGRHQESGKKAFMEEKGKRVSTGFLVLLLARHRAMTIFAAGRSDFVAGGNGRCP